jgi:large subunit ribosomal protein L30
MTKSETKSVNKGTITIRLRKGLISCNPVQRATVRGLGLKSREQVRSLENTPSVRGMIKKVLHLVEIIAETRV